MFTPKYSDKDKHQCQHHTAAHSMFPSPMSVTTRGLSIPKRHHHMEVQWNILVLIQPTTTSLHPEMQMLTFSHMAKRLSDVSRRSEVGLEVDDKKGEWRVDIDLASWNPTVILEPGLKWWPATDGGTRGCWGLENIRGNGWPQHYGDGKVICSDTLPAGNGDDINHHKHLHQCN